MDKHRKKNRSTPKVAVNIGQPLGIHDKNGVELCIGDKIRWSDEECIILYNSSYDTVDAMLCRSMWYEDNKYDEDAYGKSYQIPMDDGARMKIEKIVEEQINGHKF